MVPDSYFHQNSLIDPVKNKRAGGYSFARGFISGSASLTQEFTLSTPLPPFTFAISTEELIQRFMKTYAVSVKVLE